MIKLAKQPMYCMCHGYLQGSADDKRVHKGKRRGMRWGPRYWTGPK